MQEPSGSVRREKPFEFIQVDDPLWLLQPGDGVDALSGNKIGNLDRVVPQRGYEEALPFGVNRHVVDAPADAGQGDGAFQLERPVVLGLRHEGQAEREHSRNPSLCPRASSTVVGSWIDLLAWTSPASRFLRDFFDQGQWRASMRISGRCRPEEEPKSEDASFINFSFAFERPQGH